MLNPIETINKTSYLLALACANKVNATKTKYFIVLLGITAYNHSMFVGEGFFLKNLRYFLIKKVKN